MNYARLTILLPFVLLSLSGCGGGTYGTGVRTFEELPSDENDQNYSPWKKKDICDPAHDDRCKDKRLKMEDK